MSEGVLLAKTGCAMGWAAEVCTSPPGPGWGLQAEMGGNKLLAHALGSYESVLSQQAPVVE